MVDVFALPCNKIFNEKINGAKKLEFEIYYVEAEVLHEMDDQAYGAKYQFWSLQNMKTEDYKKEFLIQESKGCLASTPPNRRALSQVPYNT